MSAHDPHLIQAAGPELRLGGLGIHFLVSAGMTDGHATLIEHPLAPKSLGAPLHTHSREDEFSFVVEGTIGAMIGDRVVEAVAGDLVVKPRGIPHAFWNASEAPARIVELIVPAGFEGYFREIAPVLTAPRPNFARAAEICARYGIQMDTDSIGMLHARFALAWPTG